MFADNPDWQAFSFKYAVHYGPNLFHDQFATMSINSSGIIDAISRNNAGRDPDRLAMKYAKMAQSPLFSCAAHAICSMRPCRIRRCSAMYLWLGAAATCISRISAATKVIIDWFILTSTITTRLLLHRHLGHNSPANQYPVRG